MAQQPQRRSSLLLNEHPLLVMPRLAAAIGLNEALFLQQMSYWMDNDKAGHWRDGRKWVYNTYEEWHGQFPFWSVRTIRRIVSDLEKRGLLLSTSQYNQMKVDQTKWYTIDYDSLSTLEDELDAARDELDAARNGSWPDQVANVASRPDITVQVANVASPAGLNPSVQADRLAASVPETSTETSAEKDLDISKGITTTNGVRARTLFARAADEVDPEIRQYFQRYIIDHARDNNDEATFDVTEGRVLNLYLRSGLEPEDFVRGMISAHNETRAKTHLITKYTADSTDRRPKKAKMPVYFENLEQALGLKPKPRAIRRPQRSRDQRQAS